MSIGGGWVASVRRVRQEWFPEELIESWKLIGNKSGATRLGFGLLLKFYEIEGRFPGYPEEVSGRRRGLRGWLGEG